jgi:hypothetical protein
MFEHAEFLGVNGLKGACQYWYEPTEKSMLESPPEQALWVAYWTRTFRFSVNGEPWKADVQCQALHKHLSLRSRIEEYVGPNPKVAPRLFGLEGLRLQKVRCVLRCVLRVRCA